MSRAAVYDFSQAQDENEPMSATSKRRPPGRPRTEESPASLEDIYRAALTAFATHGYDGVALRTLNRELGVSHNLLNGRFGSKEALWYATVDWAFQPLALRLATAFDPTLTDPLDQLRITMRTFLVHSAEHPELLGLMNIEGRQDTERLAYVYNTHIQPALAPVHRLLDHLAAEGRTRPVSLRTFHFLLAHGAAAPFTLAPLARHFDPADPLDPAAVQAHADLAADLIVRALEIDHADDDGPPPRRGSRPAGAR
jgi:AcrR family transcriptional regulator